MDLFFLQVLLSFFVGAIWIALATVLSEKFGTKIGGIIAGLPSTMLVSLFFIAWTQSTDALTEAVAIVPLAMCITTIFVVVQIALSKKGLYKSLFGALLFWFICSIIISFSGFNNIFVAVLLYLPILIISFYILEFKFRIKSSGKKKVKYTFSQMILRGLLGGSTIAFSVLMAKFGGPIFGGIFSVFPAVFVSSIIITTLTHGKKYCSEFMKIAMLSAGLNCIIYALCIGPMCLNFGIWIGTFISYLITLISSFLIHFIVEKSA